MNKHNIIVTKYSPPRFVLQNARGSALKRYVFNQKTKKFEPSNGAAKRAEGNGK